MKDTSAEVLTAVKEIKSAIVRAQSRVVANANAEMLSLYFGIGRYVSNKTKTEKWGTGIIDTISAQLQKEMPGLRGFSGKSMRKMRQFFETWGNNAIWSSTTANLDMSGSPPSPPVALKLGQQEAVSIIWPSATAKFEAANGVSVTAAEFMSISFSHHMEILSGVKTLEERLFYIHETAQNKWKERQLRESIKRDDFRRRGAMPSNFRTTIPDAALARRTRDMFRDEYLLDFVNLDDIEATTGEDVDERVVEKSIVANIRQFITEFGKDFSLIGNQYRVEAAGHEHFIDLLFFNRELNALVAVELKKGEFKPIYLGQLNLYLQALDDTVKKPHENASVGIILCQSADKPYVEYAIRDYNKPLGVATYRTADEMPEKLKRALPPIDELRKQLEINS